jgi:hypothetical protein
MCLSSVGFYVCLRFVQRRICREVLFVTVEACLSWKGYGKRIKRSAWNVSICSSRNPFFTPPPTSSDARN